MMRILQENLWWEYDFTDVALAPEDDQKGVSIISKCDLISYAYYLYWSFYITNEESQRKKQIFLLCLPNPF